MTDTAVTGDRQVGLAAAMSILRTRAGLRLVVTSQGINERTNRAPLAGTHNTVEILIDALSVAVLAHGRNSTRVLDSRELPYPQSSIEHASFAAHLTQAVDDAWRLVVDTAVAS